MPNRRPWCGRGHLLSSQRGRAPAGGRESTTAPWGGAPRSEGSFGTGGSSGQRKLSAAAEKHRAAEKKCKWPTRRSCGRWRCRPSSRRARSTSPAACRTCSLCALSLFAPVCSHVMTLEPVDCLRENKRTQLTALRSVWWERFVDTNAMFMCGFFAGRKDSSTCISGNRVRYPPMTSADIRSILRGCQTEDGHVTAHLAASVANLRPFQTPSAPY